MPLADKSMRMNKVVSVITELMKKFKEIEGITGSGSTFRATLIHGGGKGTDPPRAAKADAKEATAFYWRSGDFFGYIYVEWVAKRFHHKDRMKDFLKTKCKPALSKYALGEKAAFLNFTDRDLDGWETAYYGENYKRLQKAKKEWDPHNVFQFQQSIKLPPAQGTLKSTAQDNSQEVESEGHSTEAIARTDTPVVRTLQLRGRYRVNRSEI
ncbi:berberine and berberine like-domain-containing protein [Kalaharituber pfeilii]|nr:berberine and berberine like-domain-containing protein [Kalaharituber pfeilii]